ncbi:hypothetical protein G9A89_021910 [Geosiphon pyriformis]|nr:hypothetical protein G9A89_021910 [Geosiphon pyriformis]
MSSRERHIIKKGNRKLKPFRNKATEVQSLLLFKGVPIKYSTMTIAKLIHKSNAILPDRHGHPILKKKELATDSSKDKLQLKRMQIMSVKKLLEELTRI